MKQYLFILLSFLLASCAEQEIGHETTGGIPGEGLRLSVRLGNGTVTRAPGDPFLSESEEKRIDRLAFFVHTDEDGLQVYPPVPDDVTDATVAATDYPNHVYLAETAAGSRQYTADVTLTAGGGYMADIVAVANLPADYDYNQIVTWDGLQDSVTVWAAEMPACTPGTGINDPDRRALVMYGYTREELAKEETNVFTLALERLVARIDITNEAYVQGMTAADPKGGFLLTSVRVLQARPASYITPQPGYTSPDVATISDWQVTDIPYGKATALDADANPTREPDAVDAATAEADATLQYLWRTLYTYENSDTEHAPTALEIKGAFRGTEVTRRIDFIDTDKKPVPLVRNHRYLVRILPAPGQTDITFDIKVSEWDAVDTVNVKPDQTVVPEITNIGGNVTPNLTNEVAKTYDVYYTQDGELTFDATCPFAPGVRVKYYDPHTDSWTTKGDWLKVKQVGSTEIVTKADHTYKNSFQVTFNKFEGGVTRKAMLLVHNGGSEVECDTILLRHVVTYPGTDFEPEAVAKRDDGSDIIVAPVNVGATKVVDRRIGVYTGSTEEEFQEYADVVGYFFQWGRKSGQKYKAGKSDVVQESILIAEESSEKYRNVFIGALNDSEYESWSIDSDPTLWNAGTDDVPVKGTNDPCPAGWRVATKKELDKIKDKVLIDTDMWIATIKDSNIKLPATCLVTVTDKTRQLGISTLAWFSSYSESDAKAAMLYFPSVDAYENGVGKASATPVRCIQEQTPSL